MFDYGAEAELFPKRPGLNVRRKMGYRRFSRAADAVQFAIETLSPALLDGACLEVKEERFNGREIRLLYDDTRFPLQRSPGK
jgi:hypothetical protein